jgi:type III pantothenate kinase
VEVHFVSMMTTFLSLMGETPQTLGIDRMVLAAEQLYSFRGKNRLVDAGTCVTFDFINEVTNILERNRP